MADKRKSTPMRGIIVYILLIIVTGFILNATGHFDDPIAAISASMVPEGAEVSKGDAPPDGIAGDREGGDEVKEGSSTQEHSESDENKEGAPASGDPTLTHEEAESINWARFGDVFFDLWFIALVTAVIMVIQQLFSFAIRLFNKRSHTAQPR